MYYFIGIKGTGMSALALIMKSLGYEAMRSRYEIRDLKQEVKRWQSKYKEIKEAYHELFENVRGYLKALKAAPARIAKAISDVLREDQEEKNYRRIKR